MIRWAIVGGRRTLFVGAWEFDWRGARSNMCESTLAASRCVLMWVVGCHNASIVARPVFGAQTSHGARNRNTPMMRFRPRARSEATLAGARPKVGTGLGFRAGIR